MLKQCGNLKHTGNTEICYFYEDFTRNGFLHPTKSQLPSEQEAHVFHSSIPP